MRNRVRSRTSVVFGHNAVPPLMLPDRPSTLREWHEAMVLGVGRIAVSIRARHGRAVEREMAS